MSRFSSYLVQLTADVFQRFSSGSQASLVTRFSRTESTSSHSFMSRQSVLAFLLVLLTTVFSVGNAWGAEEVYYTLTPSNGTNNSYAGNCDITINNITWNLEGNSQVSPWKLGANSSTALNNTNRSIYSKTVLDENISKIEVTHGASANITVNSMTVIVSKNSNFSSPISTLTPEFVANDKVTITRPDGKDWSNCYYKITYSLTGSKSKSNTIQFSEAKFYYEASGGGTPEPANYNIPKFAVSIPSGTIGVRCSQHSLRQHTLSRVYALSY